MADSEFDDVMAAIREQWASMAGMAGMFTFSILLGVFIRTFCKRAEFTDVHAVGKGMDVLEDHGHS
ncbi:MAG: hypothetical protein QGF32_05815, partial [Candidatus Thalassarchaeaceae archaeon]|nr:hypothetical protein [Candidatus Thalassarchaeaceae archaeon]